MGQAPPGTATDLSQRFDAFITERFPFAIPVVKETFDACAGLAQPDAASLENLRRVFGPELRARTAKLAPTEPIETTPGSDTQQRFQQAIDELVQACDGFLRRAAIRASLTRDERREILRGMVLTRATDNRLKMLFTGGEVRYGEAAFQGKGFRSLGQEAIYAAGVRLRRGETFRHESEWRGDVVAPVIRDLGAALAMRPTPEMVRLVLSAQMAKAGPPMDGRDLHIGDLSWGILPASAPLAIGSLTIAGLALAFASDTTPEKQGRVAISFIGEGGSSLGEWHEAINLCAARRLPAIFCLENNQTALSTPLKDQSAVRVFADKAAGYGIPGITIDGTDPDEVAAAFAWAVERARAGLGPALLELVSMRMCGHAHHDDMLYLGKDPQPSWEYPTLHAQGYADADLFAFWSARDPIATYAATLQAAGVIDDWELDRLKHDAEKLVDEEAQAVIAAP